MHTRTGTVLLLVAAGCTAYAAFAFIVGIWTDFEVAAVAGVLALGGIFAIEHVSYERRRRAARHRDKVWARRERETGYRS